MSWYIVADSGCNLRSYESTCADIAYHFVPLKINVGGREFIDDADLDVEELNRAVAAEQEATSSACPSAGEWAEEFRKADNVIAITISGSLSGSYEAAEMARAMVLEEDPSKNIYVYDSRSAGGKLEIVVEELIRYLSSNPKIEFASVVKHIEEIHDRIQIVFSLSHYDNLVKNGRLPKAAGMIANKLNIRMMGTATDEGTIKVIGSTRGDKKAYKKIVERMAELGFNGGIVYIDHMQNDDGAKMLSNAIHDIWPESSIRILPCDGLCSYYAEQTGMIIGFEWFSTDLQA